MTRLGMIFATLTLFAPLGLATRTAQAQDPVDFAREVRPILSNHCFACHGPDAEGREAKLDLSNETGALRVLAPGDLGGSELWLRIHDADDPMPPEDAHNPLSPEQIATLRRWIEAGASYAPHWAFVDPVAAAAPPAVAAADEAWPLQPLDRYLLRSWEQSGQAHAGDADPATLLRRVTFDLTGLPPTLAELDRFVAQPSSYDDVVERLLASPHYGERMAMLWLDLVRYADTVGYHGDQDQRVWPYRDYVIDAFQNNMPFDQFTIEQLAGDLLPDPTQQQLIATAYNRLLQTSHEGGLQLGEYREIYMADRVRNVSAVWMGATVGCAQCHDHKFDPYTARDFHALGAFFADVDDEAHLRNPYGNLNRLPTPRLPEMHVVTPEAGQKLAALDEKLAVAKQELATAIKTLPQRYSAWLRSLRRKIAKGDSVEKTWIDDVVATGGRQQGDWQFGVQKGVPPKFGKSYRTQTVPGLGQHYTAETEARIEVGADDSIFAWVYLDPNNPPTAVMLQLQKDGRDWSHRAYWGNNDISHGRRDKPWAGYQRIGDLPALGKWARLSARMQDLGLKPGSVVRGVAFTQHGGTVHWDRSGTSTDPASPAVRKALKNVRVKAKQQAAQKVLAVSHREQDERVAAAEAAVARLEQASQRITDTMPRTLYTRALAEPRMVKVRPRGNWLDDSGEVVQPAIPAFLGKLAGGGRATRLDLARWLVDPNVTAGTKARGHGLRTARVFVNRIWAMLFGVGLCPSTEDFGGQGRPPTYPELLDALAIDFVESGWDVKQLLRTLVTSRAYRMSSRADAAALAADPFNERFARQARNRLPAEMIRDNALAISGLLVADIGGPSVKPPQPEGYYRHLNFPTRKYRADEDPRQWRRGVYVHWQRQFLHPMLRAFDAPTREECTTQRAISNTPTAALTLLNDPVFVEAARAFAAQTISQRGTDGDRLIRAFRKATQRQPSPAEIDVLKRLLARNRSHFEKHPEAAAKLLAVGRSPKAGNENKKPFEHAAWTQVMRAILNLHETITRG
ncbi:MAG: DUF1553 domain-containing protein [Planctomycetota bacterium]